MIDRENPDQSFRERMRQRTAAVNQHVEAEEWRVIKAKRGKCATCRERFAEDAFIMWRVGTREALHPNCFSIAYPHLKDYFGITTCTPDCGCTPRSEDHIPSDRQG